MAKSGRLELGDNIYGQYRSIFNQCDVIGQQSNQNRRKNAKEGLLRSSRSLKIIEVGTNRKTVCDFLLVINSNWHPISYLFKDFAAYCSNFGHFAFFEPPFGGLELETMYDVHLGLIGKRVVFPTSINWTYFARCYGWGATGQNIARKSAISLQRGQFDLKFQVEGDVPTNHFCADS